MFDVETRHKGWETYYPGNYVYKYDPKPWTIASVAADFLKGAFFDA